ncbi:MAG: type II secretion system protein [Fibromonadales bacterium]|nr:type II secretion system protein [Fibromonadales bacterium]
MIFKSGFTLIEVLTVVVMIGILATLAYSSLTDIIFTNRAKETAQAMRTFTERALAEGKRKNTDVEIRLSPLGIEYTIDSTTVSEKFANGYVSVNNASPAPSGGSNFNSGITATVRLGVSGISEEGYFVACGVRGYCAAAVKSSDKNAFQAYIKRGSSSSWEAL